MSYLHSLRISGEVNALLARAQAGDERAFQQLVGTYRRALGVHCYRMLGSKDDADEVVQETLLRAWRAIERFEPRVQFQTWLYRIATNACLDEIERRQRRPEPVAPYPDELDAQAVVDSAPIYDPAARYAMREGMELALLSAMQLLPGRQRAILILRDVLGWTTPEVAELLESTVAAVNGALHRARSTVDQNLGAIPCGGLPDDERRVLDAYVTAFEREDVDGLVALLRDDAILRMPPQPAVVGAESIVRFWREVGGRGTLAGMRLTPRWANRGPVVLVERITEDGHYEPDGVIALTVSGGQVVRADAFVGAKYVQPFGPLGSP